MKKLIIVTGGTGLIGGHLILELLKKGQRVRVLIREGANPEKVFQVWKHYHPNPSELLSKAEWLETDMHDRECLENVIEQHSCVYHCAGQVSFQNKQLNGVYENNLALTRNLVNTCVEKQIHKFVHVSSIATIGNGEYPEIVQDENAPIAPGKKRGYSDSKIQAELEVWRAIAEGLNAVIVNPSIVLGPGNWATGSSRIFDAIYKGLRYYPMGASGYIGARDTARAMITVMESEISGERFILNSGNLSFEEMFQKVAHALGVAPPRHAIGKFATEVAWRLESIKSLLNRKDARITRQSAKAANRKSAYSSKKFAELFNFEFTPIDTTIQDVAKCYLNERGR